MSEKIKVGIILQETIIEQWIFKTIERLRMTDFADIVLVLNPENSDKNSEKNPSLIFRMHEIIDSILYSGRYSYNTLIECSALIKDVPVISYSEAESFQRNVNEIETRISSAWPELEILLNFSNQAVPDTLLKRSKYGLLTFKVGRNGSPGNSNAAYYSLVTHQPEIECFVTLASIGENEIVVCRSSVSKFSNSIHINLNRVLGLAELLIPRVVRWLCQKDRRLMNKLARETSPDIAPALTVFDSPSSYEALKNLIRIQMRSLKKKVFYLDNEYWFLLFSQNDQFNPLNGSFKEFLKLKPSKDCYWADPFLVYEQGKHYLFIEEYSYRTGRGHLAVLQPDGEGHFQQSEVILKAPYHLSYPFIFKYEDTFYMIPETKAERVIQIYRCRNFPGDWEFVTNLMEDVAAADTTVFYYKNRWWLFTSIDMLNNPEISFGELFLYYSDDLFAGKWTSHPLNPVVTEIRQSRPAGRIFEHNGMIIRPSQDCSGGYGKAVNLNQIIMLTESEYEEKIITRFAPDSNSELAGMHTFNSSHGFYVLDACILRKRFN